MSKTNNDEARRIEIEILPASGGYPPGEPLHHLYDIEIEIKIESPISEDEYLAGLSRAERDYRLRTAEAARDFDFMSPGWSFARDRAKDMHRATVRALRLARARDRA